MKVRQCWRLIRMFASTAVCASPNVPPKRSRPIPRQVRKPGSNSIAINRANGPTSLRRGPRPPMRTNGLELKRSLNQFLACHRQISRDKFHSRFRQYYKSGSDSQLQVQGEMSALGTKRTLVSTGLITAIGPKRKSRQVPMMLAKCQLQTFAFKINLPPVRPWTRELTSNHPAKSRSSLPFKWSSRLCLSSLLECACIAMCMQLVTFV